MGSGQQLTSTKTHQKLFLKEGVAIKTYMQARSFDDYLTRVNWRFTKAETEAMLVRLPNYIEEKRKTIGKSKPFVLIIKPFVVEEEQGSKPEYNTSPF